MTEVSKTGGAETPPDFVEKNERFFEWSEHDEAALSYTDRDPRTVARSSKALAMRQCSAIECRLEGNINMSARHGAFLCDLSCDGPQQAVRHFGYGIQNADRS